MTEIPGYMFKNATYLQHVNIPDSVTSIGYAAFDGCESLSKIVIPDGVTEIGSYAFSSCKSLENVTIPAAVKSVGSYIFSDCTLLKDVTVKNPDMEFNSWGNAFSNDTLLTLHCYKDSTAVTYAKENSINFDTSLGERPSKLNGLSKASDGNWYFYKDNEVDGSYTGLAQYGGSWWYVKDGKLDFSATTLCKYNGTWWYVS